MLKLLSNFRNLSFDLPYMLFKSFNLVVWCLFYLFGFLFQLFFIFILILISLSFFSLAFTLIFILGKFRCLSLFDYISWVSNFPNWITSIAYGVSWVWVQGFILLQHSGLNLLVLFLLRISLFLILIRTVIILQCSWWSLHFIISLFKFLLLLRLLWVLSIFFWLWLLNCFLNMLLDVLRFRNWHLFHLLFFLTIFRIGFWENLLFLMMSWLFNIFLLFLWLLFTFNFISLCFLSTVLISVSFSWSSVSVVARSERSW